MLVIHTISKRHLYLYSTTLRKGYGRHFLNGNYLMSKHHRKKIMTHFGILRKRWERIMSFLMQKNISKSDPTLTWPLSKVSLNDATRYNDHRYRHLSAKCPGKHISHGMLVTFIFSDLLLPNLELDILNHDLRNHAAPFPDKYPHFGCVRALCSLSNPPYGSKCKKTAFYIWPNLDLTRAINLKNVKHGLGPSLHHFLNAA